MSRSKELREDNWLQPDEVMQSFVKLSPGDVMETMVGEDWLRPILRPRLLDSVPEEVRALFEGARGALAYGYFYYPLYFLGAAELFRVAEAAVARKCEELAAPTSRRKFGPSFDENIKWLAARGVLQPQEWDAIREGRNFASHLKTPAVITPATAISMLEGTADRINALFPRS